MKPDHSSAQATFVKNYKRQKFSIWISRFLILFTFLSLWEISVNAHWIDGFIFSSPSRVAKPFGRWSQTVPSFCTLELL